MTKNKRNKPSNPQSASSPGEGADADPEVTAGPDSQELPPPPTPTVRRDAVLWISVLLYGAVLATMWWLYSTQTDLEKERWANAERRRLEASSVAAAAPMPLKVTVFDEVTIPEGEVQIQAKYERDGPGMINPDRKELAVIMGLHRSNGVTEPRKAVTDDDGMARATFKAPKTPGEYQIFSHAEEKKEYVPRTSSVPPLLFVYPADQPLLICDLDNTVTSGESLNVSGIEPRPDAAAVLTRLSAKYGIIYLTARDEGLLDRSRAWLDKHGFPRAPVLCRDWKITNLRKQGEFKTEVLKRLKASFTNFRWGIGNAKSDRQAYNAIKLSHIIIGETGDETKNDVRFVGLEHWRDVEAIVDSK